MCTLWGSAIFSRLKLMAAGPVSPFERLTARLILRPSYLRNDVCDAGRNRGVGIHHVNLTLSIMRPTLPSLRLVCGLVVVPISASRHRSIGGR